MIIGWVVSSGYLVHFLRHFFDAITESFLGIEHQQIHRGGGGRQTREEKKAITPILGTNENDNCFFCMLEKNGGTQVDMSKRNHISFDRK